MVTCATTGGGNVRPSTGRIHRATDRVSSSLTRTLDMAKKTNTGGWKTCSRGHKYRGPGPCPICWPGGAKVPPRTVRRAPLIEGFVG